MTEYKKLDKVENYDQEAAEELAAACNEANQLKQRIAYLQELYETNEGLHPFVWRKADGEVLALHKIKDDHLANIMKHLLETGRPISKEIRAEARKRSIVIPTGVVRSYIPEFVDLLDSDLDD